MILDERAEFVDDGALNTGAPAAYVLGDVMDLGAALRDIGPGEDVYFVAQVTTAVTITATGTVKIELVSSAAPALTTPRVHLASATWLAAAPPGAGVVLIASSLPQGQEYLRYLGVLQTTGVAAVTAGKINAFLTHDYAKFRAYADAL